MGGDLSRLETKQRIDGFGVVVRMTVVDDAVIAFHHDGGRAATIDASIVRSVVSGHVFGKLEAFVQDSRMRSNRNNGDIGKRYDHFGSHSETRSEKGANNESSEKWQKKKDLK